MARVELRLVGRGSGRFWEASTRGRSLVVRSGRVGTDGKTEEKAFPHASAAGEALEELVAGKTREGYVATRGKTATAGLDALGRALASLSKLARKPLVPARAADVAALEELVGGMPSALRRLYALGANLDDVPEADGASLLSLKTAKSFAKDLRRFGLPETVVPFATDGAGNFTALDATTAKLVDWDHETRRVKKLGGSIAAWLVGRILRPLQRDAKDAAAIARQATEARDARGAGRASGMPDAPRKLVSIPNALLRSRDRASYGGGIQALAFLDRQRLAAGFSNSVEVLKTGNKTSRSTYVGSGALAFDPASRRLLAVGHGDMALVDSRSLRPLLRVACDVGHGPVAVFSPDGSLACAGDVSGRVNLYDAKGGKGLPKGLVKEHTPSYALPKSKPLASLEDSGHVRSIRFSADGATLAIATEGGVRLWDVARRRASKTIPIGDGVAGADFSPLDGSLVVGRERGTVEVFDANGKRKVRTWSTKGRIAHLRVLPNGFVATVSEKALQLFEPGGKRVATLARKPGEVSPRVEDVLGDTLLLRGPAELVRVLP